MWLFVHCCRDTAAAVLLHSVDSSCIPDRNQKKKKKKIGSVFQERSHINFSTVFVKLLGYAFI